eukprot:gene8169-5698_t
MSQENQVALPAEENQVADYNSNLPVTENRIEEVFNQLDVENAGVVRFEEAVDFYLSLEHFGLEPTKEDAEQFISRFAATTPGALTYDEFACFILSIAQW